VFEALLATEITPFGNDLSEGIALCIYPLASPLNQNGERTQGEKDLLQGKEVHEAHPAQGDPVQGRQGFQLCSGSQSLIKVQSRDVQK
jgi:hypothetical protein